MDGRGARRDNVVIERLWNEVKYERVYLYAYNSANEARRSIMHSLDWYNRSRKGLGDLAIRQLSGSAQNNCECCQEKAVLMHRIDRHNTVGEDRD